MLDFLQGLLDPAKREQRSFEKLVSKLVSKNHQHEDRMLAIETLSEMDTPAAIRALFRRWDMSADKAREDLAEKEYLADVLVAKGERMLPALRKHNDRSLNVTWPIQVMRRVSTAEEVTTEILRVLEAERARLASFKPEKKVHLVRLLSDQTDDRICPAVQPLLDDFDETVRYEAVELLGSKGTAEHAAPLIDRLVHEDEDSERVRGAIRDVLAKNGWRVADRKADLSGHLGDYVIGHGGALQKKPS